MYLGPDSRGQQPLISEAVRGEGAFLVDFEGTRFMQGQHELADLAPRDVVAKAITRRMHETGHPHMWLDRPGIEQRRATSILATPLPDDPRDLPGARRGPGDRADPGRPGVPLRLGWRRDRPVGPLRRTRSLRDRRGRVLRRPRRQPPRLELPARGPGVLPAHRAGAARRAAAVRRPGDRRASPGTRRGRRPPGAPGDDDRGGRRAALCGRADPRARGARRAGRQGRRGGHPRLGGHQPGHAEHGARRVGAAP